MQKTKTINNIFNICKRQIAKNKYKMFFIVLNFLMTAGVVLFCHPVYETNDDFGISNIAWGIYGENYKQYLVLSNVIYGYVLKVFSACIASVNWYVVFEYLWIAISYSVLFYLLGKRSFSLSVIMNILSWFMVIYSQVRFIQFTRTAFILCISGFALMIYSCLNNSKKAFYFALFLCIVGSFVRFKCILICIAYMLAFLVVYSFQSNQTINNKKYLIKRFFIVVTIVMACQFFDYVYYTSNSEWKDYKEYKTSRSELLDYSLPSYDENKDKYESIGFSKNDVRILSYWILDTNKFSTERLKQIASWKSRNSIDKTFPKNVQELCSDSKDSILFVTFVLTIILLICSKNKGAIALSILNAIGTIFIFLYFYYIGRMLPRVSFGIWMQAIVINVIGLFYLAGVKIDNLVKNKEKLFSVLTILGVVLMLCAKSIGLGASTTTSEEKAIAYFEERQSSKYVLDTRSFVGVCNVYCPYKVDDSYQSNYCTSGGWMTDSPFMRNHIKTVIGRDNLIEGLLDDNVYWVERQDIRHVDDLLTYIQENYNINCTVEQVDIIDKFAVYKFSA